MLLIKQIMDNIIDDSYFWGERYIPKLANTSSQVLGQAALSMKNDLDMYIAKYQKYYFEAMFGTNTPAAALIDLIRDEDTKTSPLADIVYYFYQRDKASATMPSGEKAIALQNSIIATAAQKAEKAWNDAVRFNRALHEKWYSDGTITVEGGNDIDYINTIYNEIDFTHDIFCYINYWNA